MVRYTTRVRYVPCPRTRCGRQRCCSLASDAVLLFHDSCVCVCVCAFSRVVCCVCSCRMCSALELCCGSSFTASHQACTASWSVGHEQSLTWTWMSCVQVHQLTHRPPSWRSHASAASMSRMCASAATYVVVLAFAPCTCLRLRVLVRLHPTLRLPACLPACRTRWTGWCP